MNTKVTMILDCMGFDPDAVMLKLQKDKGTIGAYFHRYTQDRIAGYMSEVRRIKGGLEVDIETDGDRPGFFQENQRGKLSLSIAGSTTADGDFNISWLNIQPARRLKV
jgi:hypothetical protein